MAVINPVQAQKNAEIEISALKSNSALAVTTFAFSTTDLETDGTNAFISKLIVVSTAAVVSGYYVMKMNREIARIRRRAGGPQGFMYSLTTNGAGNYPVFSWGNSAPTGNIHMGANEVWKFGETSSKKDRYTRGQLQSIGFAGVTQNRLYSGNQVQIKVAEKVALYAYFIHYGHLPPGNKMFR